MHTVLFKRASPLHLRKPGNQQYYCNLLSSAHSQPRRAQRRVGRMSAAAAVVCSPLWARVIEVYDKAQESGAATKTDTKVQVCEDGGIAFVLRIASALKSKPKGISGSTAAGATNSTTASQQQQASAALKNPFLPYEAALWVQHLSSTHTLLLNKFNVVPHHVLVVTRQFESQQDPLDANDLAATQEVLSSMPRGGVAFYNCGQHSGRSQPHKHLQIVPLPFSDHQLQQQQQVECSTALSPMDHVVMSAQAAAGAAGMQAFLVKQLPYRAYAAVLDQSATPEQLAAAVDQLLLLCQAGLAAPVSYNVVMTNRFLLMVPRKQEMCGRIAVNSLGFAGTILLRSEENLAYAVERGPLSMLAEVGQPWDTEPQQASLTGSL